MRQLPYWIVIWFLIFGSLSPIYGQGNKPEPLSNIEWREILLRLNQLPLAWDEIDLLRKTMAQNDQLTQRERALAGKELETEKERTALAEKEAAIEKARARFYEQAFERLTRKRGFGCAIKKAITLGLAHCS